MSAVPVAIKTEEVILEHAEYNSAEELGVARLFEKRHNRPIAKEREIS